MVKIRAILFDLDGVLVDAKTWHYRALNQALEDAGYAKISKEEHLKRFDGLPTFTKLRMLSEDGLLPNDQKLFNSIYKNKQEYVARLIKNNTKPSTIINDTLFKLHHDYKLACCSNVAHRQFSGLGGDLQPCLPFNGAPVPEPLWPHIIECGHGPDQPVPFFCNK